MEFGILGLDDGLPEFWFGAGNGEMDVNRTTVH